MTSRDSQMKLIEARGHVHSIDDTTVVVRFENTVFELERSSLPPTLEVGDPVVYTESLAFPIEEWTRDELDIIRSTSDIDELFDEKKTL